MIEWNQKLKISNFEDSELEINGDRVLKQRASNAYKQADEFERTDKFEYYCFLSYLVAITMFPTKFEEIIMEGHSQGKTIQEIVQCLNNHGFSRNRRTVRFIIRRWEMKWGLRTWSLKEMDLKVIK